METSLHLELDLPLTGIVELGGRVGMPSFDVSFCEADHIGNQATNFGMHFSFLQPYVGVMCTCLDCTAIY